MRFQMKVIVRLYDIISVTFIDDIGKLIVSLHNHTIYSPLVLLRYLFGSMLLSLNFSAIVI